MSRLARWWHEKKAGRAWRSQRHTYMRQAVDSHAGGSGVRQFGKRFMTTFPEITLGEKKRNVFVVSADISYHESPVAVVLWREPAREITGARGAALGEAKLLFEKDAVTMLFQGGRKAQPWLERFREMHGVPWAEFLAEKVEEHARRCGFRQVRIAAPETLKYYKEPLVRDERLERKMRELGLPQNTPKEQLSKVMDLIRGEIRGEIKALHEGVARKRGYKREGGFFFKGL